MGGGKGQSSTRLRNPAASRPSKGPRVGTAPCQPGLRLHELPVPAWHSRKGSHALTSLLSFAGFQQSPRMLSCRGWDEIWRGIVGLPIEQPLPYLAALQQDGLQGDTCTFDWDWLKIISPIPLPYFFAICFLSPPTLLKVINIYSCK